MALDKRSQMSFQLVMIIVALLILVFLVYLLKDYAFSPAKENSRLLTEKINEVIKNNLDQYLDYYDAGNIPKAIKGYRDYYESEDTPLDLRIHSGIMLMLCYKAMNSKKAKNIAAQLLDYNLQDTDRANINRLINNWDDKDKRCCKFSFGCILIKGSCANSCSECYKSNLP
jgi:Tfp pilus assembly protein PilN